VCELPVRHCGGALRLAAGEEEEVTLGEFVANHPILVVMVFVAIYFLLWLVEGWWFRE